jgi:hypothetical protein
VSNLGHSKAFAITILTSILFMVASIGFTILAVVR